MLDLDGHCRLIDFGFACAPPGGADGLMKTNCGTPAYLSPEQLSRKKTGGYTRIVDWWAFGCVFRGAGTRQGSLFSRDSPSTVAPRLSTVGPDGPDVGRRGAGRRALRFTARRARSRQVGPRRPGAAERRRWRKRPCVASGAKCG